MNNRFNSWILALRPRTLFLAVATALCGSSIAYSTGTFSISICILTILTATILQLMSNLANDLGDFQHGTDTTGERVGPQRAVQSGAISPSKMRKAILVTIILAVITGLGLIYEASQFMPVIIILLFIALGSASIIAAIKYTAGKNPYGYRGLGDIFSFVFFGPVSVVGTYFLHTHQFNFQPWLPAIGLGLFTIAVLNINNMRDMENDRKSKKITVAIKLGFKNAKYYHMLLTICGIACFLTYNVLYTSLWLQNLYVLIFLFFLKILYDIFKINENKKLDPYLRYTSMTTFLLVVCFSICINANSILMQTT